MFYTQDSIQGFQNILRYREYIKKYVKVVSRQDFIKEKNIIELLAIDF